MRFSRLRLSGFKSFVDPTELLIEPDLTGVVGPNGCGKSNLLEALRWVMGENRAKSLRGSGMDDVIFAGTDKLSPRNFAEVTLVIDNVDRNAPAGFNEEDFIEVTRRIERESGSAYRINGKDVRQKDVQLLFADAATGAHSPALVSQGRIGTLINAKPQDRRAILEEASGISGLHTRRKEAESKLRSAESNLVRVQDVIQAMDGQIASLKRQARQAIRYKEVSGDIQKAEASTLYLKWQQAAEEVISQENKLRDHQKSVASIQAQVTTASKEQVEAATVLPDLRNRDAEMAAKLQRLTIEKENLENETARREEMARSLNAVVDQSKADIEREQEIANDAKAFLERLSSEKTRLEEANASQEDAEAKAGEELEVAVNAASEAEKDYDAQSEHTAQARARRASLESDNLAVARRAEQIEIEKNRLTQELQTLEASDRAAALVKEAETNVAAGEAKLNSVNIALAELEQKRTEARAKLSAVQDEKTGVDTRLKTIESEISGLEALLAKSDQGSQQSVADLISAKSGYEKAIGAAIGDDIEAGQDDSLSRYWSAVSADGSTSDSKWPEGVQPISNFVDVPDVLNARVANIGVLEAGIDGAKLVASLKTGQRLVSKDGDLWRWDGFISKAGAPSVAAMRLEQKNRLTALSQDLEQRQKEAKAATQKTDEARSLLDATQQAEKEARAERQNVERSLADARRSLVSAEGEASKNAGRLSMLRDTVTRNDNEATETNKRLEEIADQINALPDATGQEEALAEKRKLVEKLREELAAARAQYDSLRRDTITRNDRLKAIGAEFNAWEQRSKGAEEQVKALGARQSDAYKQLDALNANPEETRARQEKLMDSLEEAQEARRQSADALVIAENALKEKDTALQECQNRLAQSRETLIRSEGSLEHIKSKRKDIAALIGERFECAPTYLLEKVGLDASDSLPNLIVLEEKLEKLKRERDRLGAVNLRADEELSEISEQRDHLVSEREDLEAAIARLRQAIGGLNKEGRERLLKAFDIVNNHFSELFTTLFGGGHAHLELTESDDPLNAGLEIFASPPGKKLQSLSLLSGGEQALTALALIFAVFITNPAPICVLDEVDAPLDDANVERFCNLLDNMMERTDTRFLIVTHNAVTMSRMKRLFGVTMAQRGISTLVSVDLERAEALRDAS